MPKLTGALTTERYIELKPAHQKAFALWEVDKSKTPKGLCEQLKINGFKVARSTVRNWLVGFNRGKFPKVEETKQPYSCTCQFTTPDLKEFRRHLLQGGKVGEPGMHKSLHTGLLKPIKVIRASTVVQSPAPLTSAEEIVDAFIARLEKLRSENIVLNQKVSTLEVLNSSLKTRCDLAEAKTKADFRAKMERAIASAGD